MALCAVCPLTILVVEDTRGLDGELVEMERKAVDLVSHYKFGILYCAAGQKEENEMFCNGMPLNISCA